MSSLIPAVPKHKKVWYRKEKSTSALIRSVAASRFNSNLSGDQIWSLVTLTWITRSPKKIPTNHWRKLKVPALAIIVRQEHSHRHRGLVCDHRHNGSSESRGSICEARNRYPQRSQYRRNKERRSTNDSHDGARFLMPRALCRWQETGRLRVHTR